MRNNNFSTISGMRIILDKIFGSNLVFDKEGNNQSSHKSNDSYEEGIIGMLEYETLLASSISKEQKNEKY